MHWIWTKDAAPPKDETVLGALLHKFRNAEWEWMVYLYIRPSSYEVPTVWMPIKLPPLPESPEREKAKRYAERKAEYDKKYAALRAEYGDLI